jgi:hypothetical protein
MTRLSRLARTFAVPISVITLVTGCTAPLSPMTRSGPNAMPTNLTVYVKTTCSFTATNTLVPTDPANQVGRSMTDPAYGHGRAIPAGFTPVAVIGCPFAVLDPASGTRTATQTKADSGLDDLFTAYRMPAPTVEIPAGPRLCSADFDPDPVIAFVDASGTAVWPAPPRDANCDHISTRVRTALAAVHWTVTKSERVATSP